jgi:ATP-binding cassette subfamily F protein 3
MLFRLQDITRSYGGDDVLKGVSFQINPGEKVGLVGRNGAGKTTIFRMITGVEDPDSGEVVKINGLKLGLLEQHVDFAADETVHTAALSAFKEIHDIEAELRLLEKQMETDHSPEILDRYADLQIAYERADGFTYAARAEAILIGIGFPPEKWSMRTSELSGGQKNRLGMARLLLSAADVLLLDEPTNHLDVGAVEWLEDFLGNCDKTYVVISHDRYFLDRTTNRIIEVENGKAASYKGNYSKFLKERELRREQQIREYENQQAYINKTKEFIRRNLEGQKTKQAKSRRTMLERLERIESITPEKAGGNFVLRNVERAGNNVLTVDELTIGYPKKTLASGIHFSMFRGDVLGIIGANGTGKTTLLKTLAGSLRELGGEFHWGTKTNIGYYSQNLDDLEPRNEVILELRRVAPLADTGQLRSFLANFLFFGDDVFKPVSALSGGEKGRLALAKLIYSEKNVLILDEPTNHLDIPSREALENALMEYPGTIITVSHDRFFLDKIANQILAFDADGSVESYNGNYTEYHDWRAANAQKTTPEKRPEPEPQKVEAAKPAKNGSPLSKNERDKIEKRIKNIETELPTLEAKAASLTEQMSDPETAADFPKLAELTKELSRTETRIKELYAEWEAADAKLD